ncbi:MAG: hypothetical protein DRJ40_02660 [Thermoprotei archaeon]|nr:MAG: hypothetical protein DRJ40_02660 [Thermoprotei archaeon]
MEKLKDVGVDVESLIIDLIVDNLNLKPEEELEVHRELARRFLEEGMKLIDVNPVQASEKLYKAAEEAVKTLVLKHRLRSIVERVEKRGRWKVEDLFDAISELRQIYSDDIRRWWDSAWNLHVWGFHEAKATKRYVEERIRDVEELVKLAIE